jgi:hypothetical protein
VTTPQHMSPEHLIMDTLERLFRATKWQNGLFDCGKVNITTSYTEQNAT